MSRTKQDDYVRVGIYLTKIQVAQISTLAREQRMARSELIRRFLDEGILRFTKEGMPVRASMPVIEPLS